MFQIILTVREEGGEISTETREQQVGNFVGPTLADLGLAQWMASHGGMVKLILSALSLSLSVSLSHTHTCTHCCKSYVLSAYTKLPIIT